MSLNQYPTLISNLLNITKDCLEKHTISEELSYQFMKASSDIQLYAPKDFSKIMPLQLNTLALQLHQLNELKKNMTGTCIGPGQTGNLLSLFAQSQQQEKLAEQVKDTLRYINESLPAFSQAIDSINQDNSLSP